MIKNALSLFALTVLILAFFLPSYWTMQELKHKNAEYEHRIEALEERNKRFEQERYLLQTDPEYLEKIGRERMGLVKPGETVYKIIPVTQK